MKRFWWLLRSFFEGVSVGFRETRHAISTSFEEQPESHQIVYAEFEEAINRWEARTGKKVERSFTGNEWNTSTDGRRVIEFNGAQWRNFAEFLGSREAQEYRKQWKVNLGDMIKELQRSPEMRITDEADDLDDRLREIGL